MKTHEQQRALLVLEAGGEIMDPLVARCIHPGKAGWMIGLGMGLRMGLLNREAARVLASEIETLVATTSIANLGQPEEIEIAMRSWGDEMARIIGEGN